MTDSLPEFDPTAKTIWEEFHELTKDLTDDDMLKACRDWHHEFYFVASPRRDGSAPTLEKACEERIFLMKGEADAYAEYLRNDLPGVNYRVFTATAVIKRSQ